MSTAAVTVVGGGPGGLRAAEVLALAGCRVTIVEKMPSVARKFLLAGRGGLNLTHSEPRCDMVARYGSAGPWMAPMLESFGPGELSAWSATLGEPTFIGSSGRVFPSGFRANALLRSWLARLATLGVERRTGCEFTGWPDPDSPTTITVRARRGHEQRIDADAVVLALGGASWPAVGGDGSWVPLLERVGVQVSPLVPSNVGARVRWSSGFVATHAGTPIKNVVVRCGERSARGELMITDDGLEGGALYALSAPLRAAVDADGSATLRVDLCPDLSVDTLTERLSKARPKDSTTTKLRRIGALSSAAIAVMREATDNQLPRAPDELARLISDVPIAVPALGSLDRAISSAGGVALAELDEHLMLRRLPGVFLAGEMIDWDAPTGGYLLQGTFSTATTGAQGALAWLDSRSVSA